jgi:hypothetical protein
VVPYDNVALFSNAATCLDGRADRHSQSKRRPECDDTGNQSCGEALVATSSSLFGSADISLPSTGVRATQYVSLWVRPKTNCESIPPPRMRIIARSHRSVGPACMYRSDRPKGGGTTAVPRHDRTEDATNMLSTQTGTHRAHQSTQKTKHSPASDPTQPAARASV